MNTDEKIISALCDEIADLHVTLMNTKAVAVAFANLYVETPNPSQAVLVDPDTYNNLYCVLLDNLHKALEIAEGIDGRE